MTTARWAIVLWMLLTLIGCSTPPKNMHPLTIETTPADAIVSLSINGNFTDNTRAIAGISPVQKDFNFGEQGRIWLEIEKRGYQPEILEVDANAGNVSLQLKPLADEKTGQPIKFYSFPKITNLLVVAPDFNIIDRKFSCEEIAAEDSNRAREALIQEVASYFENDFPMTKVEVTPASEGMLNSLWRDTRSAMEIVDPIRLPYLSRPAYLETKSSRQAACRLGDQLGGQAVLLIKSNQNREAGSLTAGKIGMSVIGTASSYASGYSRAIERGDSFFVYTVYTPSFAEGTLLSAALIDSSNGEILWLNKGIWGPIPFDNPDAVQAVVADLFSSLHETILKGEQQ